MREYLNRILLIIILIFISLVTIYSEDSDVSQSIKELINKGEYDEALLLTDEYLLTNNNDIEIKRLRIEVVKQINILESKRLTEESFYYIDINDFPSAFKLIEDAVRLDPDNKSAFDLYLRLQEVAIVEEDSVIEEEKIVEQERIIEEEKIREAKKAEEKAQEEIIEKESKDAKETQVVEIADSTTKSSEVSSLKEKDIANNFINFHIPVSAVFSDSNASEDISSNLILGGSGIKLEYSPPFMRNLLWFSGAYSADFYTLSGDDRVSYIIHDIALSAAARISLFPGPNNTITELFLRAGYSYFRLDNSEDEGLYFFTSIYSPTAGILIKEPILNRFFDNNIIKNFLFRFSADLWLVPIDDDRIILTDFEFGIDYTITNMIGVFVNNKFSMNVSKDANEWFYRLGIGALIKLSY